MEWNKMNFLGLDFLSRGSLSKTPAPIGNRGGQKINKPLI